LERGAHIKLLASWLSIESVLKYSLIGLFKAVLSIALVTLLQLVENEQQRRRVTKITHQLLLANASYVYCHN